MKKGDRVLYKPLPFLMGRFSGEPAIATFIKYCCGNAEDNCGCAYILIGNKEKEVLVSELSIISQKGNTI